ncbi:MAG: alpha/beta hydrolase [bacterium]
MRNTADRVRLHGWLVPASDSGRIVLLLHGNAGNISHRLDLLRILHDLGLSVFIFDYRGYGRSGGRISERGSYLDARAAYRYLVEEAGADPDNIVFFGRSLGGSIAVELATHHTPGAVILESCFPSLADVAQRAYRFLPARRLLRIRYDSTSRIKTLTCPKLIVHSRNDEIVPFDLGMRLFELAPEPKSFLEIDGDHNSGFIISGRSYTEGLGEFLRTLP